MYSVPQEATKIAASRTWAPTYIRLHLISTPMPLTSAAAELAATRKEVKYAGIVGRHMFEPIAVETLGVFNVSAVRLLNDLGRRISSISGGTRETSHLYQRVSVLVQRFNAVLLHDSLVPDCTD